MIPRRKRERKAADAELIVMLCDRKGPAVRSDVSTEAVVYIAIVPDTAKLTERRPVELHTDVVDALVDLMVELANREDVDGTSTRDR